MIGWANSNKQFRLVSFLRVKGLGLTVLGLGFRACVLLGSE